MKEEDAVIIKLYHHGTTTWSPWEICHSYSSLHSDRYLRGVAVSKVKEMKDLDTTGIKGVPIIYQDSFCIRII